MVCYEDVGAHWKQPQHLAVVANVEAEFFNCCRSESQVLRVALLHPTSLPDGGSGPVYGIVGGANLGC